MPDRAIELRSDEVQEILSFIPHWIIRWGITVIFLTILILLLSTWIIKYPEIITSRITLTTQNPPISVIARASGKLILFAEKPVRKEPAKQEPETNRFVKANTYLAAIENPADVDDVRALQEQLEAFKAFLARPDELVNFDFNKNAKLGELQVDYSNFLQGYLDYKFFLQENYYDRKIGSLQAQMDGYRDLDKRFARQNETTSSDLNLAKERYERSKILYKDGIISKSELDSAESSYLEKQYALENVATNSVNNNIRREEQQKLILDLQQQFTERKRAYIIAIQESYKKLRSQLEAWEQKYILKAPVDGYISFFKFWSEKQFVSAGDEVMTIVPQSHDIVGKVYLPLMGSGKVKVGQKVLIKFDGYPFHEFGTVEGKVESMSLVARDNRYLIDVSLPGGLQTSYRKTLEFKQDMQGSADIVTEDLRLMERMFNQLRYLFTSSVSR